MIGIRRFRYYPMRFCVGFVLGLTACSLAPRTSPSATISPALNQTQLRKTAFTNGTAPALELTALAAQGMVYTMIPSEESGAVAVQITRPQSQRYPEGAGVLVEVPGFFTSGEGFRQSLDVSSIGIVHVTFLWPGCSDPKLGLSSGGDRDYGGAGSIAALRDVIRFASGEIADRQGKKISDLAGMSVLAGNVGLYAFSHPGLAAVSVLAAYGDQFSSLRYFIGRENPTVDVISAMEIGHYASEKDPVQNPAYRYPDSFRSDDIVMDYSQVRWDPNLPSCGNGSSGAPYFDLNGNGILDSTDHPLGTQCPSMFGRRVYSAALTRALNENGAFASGEWPEDLATPEDAENWWSIRESPIGYPALRDRLPELKVMLLFGIRDHVQILRDKPHIHQAWIGFSETAGLWTRLNPDSVYAVCMGLPNKDWQDHPAGTAPEDWSTAYQWGYPDTQAAPFFIALAGVAEMADRVFYENWAPDIDQVLGGACEKK